MMKDPDPILAELARLPCRGLGAIARRFIGNIWPGGRAALLESFLGPLPARGEVLIPGVGPVTVRLSGAGRLMMDLCRAYLHFSPFRRWSITIYTRYGRSSAVVSLVHEMRHAQQLAALGYERFCSLMDSGLPNPLRPSTLEVDAMAAEASEVCKTGQVPTRVGTWPGIEGSPDWPAGKVRRAQALLDRAISGHARSLGAAKRRLCGRSRR